ncbi:hypothetical protein [Burkholderia ubonensis]|uniref:hypothetical protein n=1 Tax=Burkholderia ubonensis TaxID=101571 RepID=UPI0012FA842A|nr:hypothetical protein [Burkholderia ubonensis]
MKIPFAGARMLARLLRREGHEVGRRRMRTLMKRMGVEAMYCKPNTSRRNAHHKIWLYHRHVAGRNVAIVREDEKSPGRISCDRDGKSSDAQAREWMCVKSRRGDLPVK